MENPLAKADETPAKMMHTAAIILRINTPVINDEFTVKTYK
jgi:hypothetical protein